MTNNKYAIYPESKQECNLMVNVDALAYAIVRLGEIRRAIYRDKGHTDIYNYFDLKKRQYYTSQEYFNKIMVDNEELEVVKCLDVDLLLQEIDSILDKVTHLIEY